MRVTIDPKWTFADALHAAWDAYRGGQQFGTTNRIRVLEQWGNVVGAARAVEDFETTLKQFPSLEDASTDLGLSQYAIRKLRKNFRKMPVVTPHQNKPISLLELLRTMPTHKDRREIEILAEILPRFAAFLGYHEAEVYYEPSVGGESWLRPDALFAPEGPDRPRVVVEVKSGRMNSKRLTDGIMQVYRYCEVANAPTGVLLTPESLIILEEQNRRDFDLSTIGPNDEQIIISLLGRAATTPAPETVKQETVADGLELLLDAVAAAESNEEKKKTLEELAAQVFDVHEFIVCKYRNLRTKTSEIDIVCEFLGVSSGRHFLDEYGRYFLVECKNWNSPVGASQIRDFVQKLKNTKIRLGVLFAKSGITGEAHGTDALREIDLVYSKEDICLVVLSLQDLRTVNQIENVLALIDTELDRLRFDL